MVSINQEADFVKGATCYHRRVDEFSCAAPPGLERVLGAELKALGLMTRGLGFTGGARDLYRACLRLRTAERVFARIAKLRAPGFAELERAVGAVPWERWLSPGRPVAVRVETVRSRLYHKKGVAERVAGAISKRLKKESPLYPAEGAGAQVLDLSLDRDLGVLSLDASGDPLHRRGWRLETAKAPLRETLAASLVLSSGWDRRSPLADPFCGAGTIAIEAALIARGAAAGAGRRFGFMDWPSFDRAAWEAELSAPGPAPESPLILASDRDSGAIAAARANAERAGVAGMIDFTVRPISALELPPGPGTLVTNPPYGARVSAGRDLRDLYARFGQILRAAPGWSALMLCADEDLVREADAAFRAAGTTMNGGIGVRLWARPG